MNIIYPLWYAGIYALYFSKRLHLILMLDIIKASIHNKWEKWEKFKLQAIAISLIGILTILYPLGVFIVLSWLLIFFIIYGSINICAHWLRIGICKDEKLSIKLEFVVFLMSVAVLYLIFYGMVRYSLYYLANDMICSLTNIESVLNYNDLGVNPVQGTRIVNRVRNDVIQYQNDPVYTNIALVHVVYYGNYDNQERDALYQGFRRRSVDPNIYVVGLGRKLVYSRFMGFQRIEEMASGYDA